MKRWARLHWQLLRTHGLAAAYWTLRDYYIRLGNAAALFGLPCRAGLLESREIFVRDRGAA